LSRHILITVMMCTMLASSNCLIAILSWNGTLNFTWFMIELAWIFDIFFNTFIFLVLTRKKHKKIKVVSEFGIEDNPKASSNVRWTPDTGVRTSENEIHKTLDDLKTLSH
ncbi:MAG TPA: hypothetical protein VKR58_01285, partial [Aquella sp.]|nr:hypothetical protein [Aquella sp.]